MVKGDSGARTGPHDREAARQERRRRSLQVSTISLHALSWLLLTFYATDYLPALSIRLLVGLGAPAAAQFLVGYVTLGAVCLAIGTGFGWLYSGAIRRSRYPWRWFLFPLLVALFLVPAQGSNELLTRGVVAATLLLGAALGLQAGPLLRRSRPALAPRP